MNGLVAMGAVVVVTAAVGWALVLTAALGRPLSERALMIAGLPMSALVNVYVKAPLIALVAILFAQRPTIASATPLLMTVFLWAISPLTEEAIKLAALALPSVRRRVLADASSALWTGMAVGLGFGVGEAAYLALTISLPPAQSGLPWYAFTGFLIERHLSIFVHGVLAALSYTGVQRGGRWRFGGYGVAAALHGVTNLGAVLSRVGLVSAAIAELGLLVMVVVLALFMIRLQRSAARAPASS